MKKLFLLFFISLISICYANLSLTSTNIEDYVKIGVIEYQNNNFDRALDNFLLAENAGLSNPDLFFNIGNAYFRVNDLPNSIIYYRKALLMDSSHKGANDNLNFVLSVIRDRQQDTEENFLTSFFKNIFYFFSINSLLIICLVILAIITALIHFQWRYVKLDRTLPRFINFVLLFIFLCFVSLTVARINQVNNNAEAVIIDNIVYVYSGPNESFTRLFTIHQGTVIKINRHENGWTQITTLNGFSGWIISDAYKRVI